MSAITAEEAARMLGVSSRTALYRHFDADGVLLYVGISLSPIGRLREHHQRAQWSEEITSVTIEWHPSRREAMDAEFRAIQAERPLHNLDMNGEAVYYQPAAEVLAQFKERRDNAGKRKPRRTPVTMDEMRAALATVGRRRI